MSSTFWTHTIKFLNLLSHFYDITETHPGLVVLEACLYVTSFLALLAFLRNWSCLLYTSLFFRRYTSLLLYQSLSHTPIYFRSYVFSIFLLLFIWEHLVPRTWVFPLKLNVFRITELCRAIALFPSWWCEVISCYRMLHCYDVLWWRSEKCLSVSRKWIILSVHFRVPLAKV